MSRRNELGVQLSLSRVDIRIASAPAVQCCCWAVEGSRLDGPQFAHLGLRMGSWGRSSGPSGAIFGARPPALVLGPGHLETGELQGFPLGPSGGHGTLA